MARTKNQIINEITDDAIARLVPTDTPQAIAEEVTQDMEDLITLENTARGKSHKLRVPETLPNNVIARLMNAMFKIRRVAGAGLDARDDFDILCIYQEDGPDKGLYIESENALYQIAIQYNDQLTERGFGEILRRLRAIAPRVARTTNPDLIAVNNGVFDFRTKELMPFSPDYVFLSKSRVDYNPNATSPVIHNDEDGTDWDVESWINELSDDADVVELIWQIMSAIVRPFVPWNRSAWFYSEQGNNGKGTLCALMRQLCGETAVANIPISDFGKDFMLEPLTRATAIIVDENDVGVYLDKAANMKATVTGDAVRINRKFLKPISFRFFGFMVQCVNEMPRIKDKSDSFYRRQLIIPFTKCFTGHERKYIKTDYLRRKDVLEYVLYRVLNMWHYDLIEPQVCKEIMQEYKEANDPVRQFFQDMEPLFAWKALPYRFLYDLYKAWFSINNPSGKVQGRITFNHEMANAVRGNTTWCAMPKQFRNRDYLDKPEPLIIKYNLSDWMNPDAKTSSNADILATPGPVSHIRGLIRYDALGISRDGRLLPPDNDGDDGGWEGGGDG